MFVRSTLHNMFANEKNEKKCKKNLLQKLSYKRFKNGQKQKTKKIQKKDKAKKGHTWEFQTPIYRFS